jgi:hypothetical protein
VLAAFEAADGMQSQVRGNPVKPPARIKPAILRGIALMKADESFQREILGLGWIPDEAVEQPVDVWPMFREEVFEGLAAGLGGNSLASISFVVFHSANHTRIRPILPEDEALLQ